MDLTTQRGRITGPIAYLAPGGRTLNIPIGPCLVERMGDTVDIVWGAHAQRSTALSIAQLMAAKAHGHLVLID